MPFGINIKEAPASPSLPTFSKTMGRYPLAWRNSANTGPAIPQPTTKTGGKSIVEDTEWVWYDVVKRTFLERS